MWLELKFPNSEVAMSNPGAVFYPPERPVANTKPGKSFRRTNEPCKDGLGLTSSDNVLPL